jgi:hypothetical protein
MYCHHALNPLTSHSIVSNSSLALQLLSDLLDSPQFRTYEMSLVTTNSLPHALKHPSRCVFRSLFLSLRCSFNLVCLVAPAHHEDYTAYLTFVVCVSIVSVRYVYS